jgi:hypothetical protein
MRKLGYGEALKRSFYVLAVGLGFGIPVIQIVTMIIAYFRLTKSGMTWWDEKVGVAVVHEQIGAGRVGCFVALLFFFFLVVAILSALAQLLGASVY